MPKTQRTGDDVAPEEVDNRSEDGDGVDVKEPNSKSARLEGKSAGAGTAAGNGSNRAPRVRPPLRTAKMEAFGTLGDPLHRQRCDALVEWRNRFTPMLRIFFTTVTASLEGELIPAPQTPALVGDAHHSTTTATPSGTAATTAASSTPASGADRVFRHPVPVLSINGRPLHTGKGRADVDEFMRRDFFTEVLHEPRLFLRPYFDEPTRTVSYLLADRSTRLALLIDPNLLFLSRYVDDLNGFGFQCAAICLMDVPFDIVVVDPASLVAEAVAQHKKKSLVSSSVCGFPAVLLPSGSIDLFVGGRRVEHHFSVEGSLISIANREVEGAPLSLLGIDSPLRFEFIACPGFSKYSQVMFVTTSTAAGQEEGRSDHHHHHHHHHHHSHPSGPAADGGSVSHEKKVNILACFTGCTLGVDCGPRCDIAEDGSRVVSGEIAEERASKLWELALHKKICCRFTDNNAIFPSHGGYSHVNNALDLHWTSFWADMKRNSANRSLMDALMGPESNAKGKRKTHDSSPTEDEEPSTAARERPQVTHAEVAPGGGSGGERFGAFVIEQRKQAGLPMPFMFQACKARNEALLFQTPASSTSTDLRTVTPTRMTSDQFSKFVQDGKFRSAAACTLAPFLLDVRPLDEYASKRIEPSLSIPFSFPVDVRSAKKAELWLMTLLLPGQQLVVLCPAGQICEIAVRFWRCGFNPQLVSFIDTGDVPDGLWTKAPLVRVKTQEDLNQLQSKKVLDCRTTYEFRNGSHIDCLHLPLADLRRCGLHAIGVDLRPEEKVAVATDTIKTFNESIDAIQSKSGLVIYCAGGYRSHIAATLLRYFVAARPTAVGSSNSQVSDLVGGALQLMTKRPDLWSLKDRSIICIS